MFTPKQAAAAERRYNNAARKARDTFGPGYHAALHPDTPDTRAALARIAARARRDATRAAGKK